MVFPCFNFCIDRHVCYFNLRQVKYIGHIFLSKKINRSYCALFRLTIWFIVFNATFNYVSVISWRSVLLVEETGVRGENHRPVASHWLHFFQYTCTYTRLVIGTSRTVGSAKKFVRITSGFDGGEFTKTLRKVCTCQKLKFAFILLEYCKIKECYAVAKAFTIRNMYSLLLYVKCNSRKINRPTENMTKIVTLVHF